MQCYQGNCNDQLKILDVLRVEQSIDGGGRVASLQSTPNKMQQKLDDAG
jgi:hypothetical protein